mgnify:CR=1 FL=1
MEKIFRRFFLIHFLFSIFFVSPLFANDTAENVISIQLADGQTITIQDMPDVEQMKTALGLSVSDEIRKKIESKGGTVENVPTTHKINPLEHQAEAAAKAVVWRLAQLPANGSKFTGKFKMVVTSAYDGKQPITLTTTVSGKTATSQQAVSASASTSISACGYASCSYIPLLFGRH